MVASANPSGNNQDNSSFNGVSGTAASSAEVSGNSENSGMKHVPAPGISTDWTPEEKNTLEEGLQKYSTLSPVMRYAKIAQTLPNKTLRDVALHCRYMKVQMLPYQCITLIVVNLYTCSELLNLPGFTYILKPKKRGQQEKER